MVRSARSHLTRRDFLTFAMHTMRHILELGDGKPPAAHRLCDYFVDDLSVHIGQSEISATVAEGEFLVI